MRHDRIQKSINAYLCRNVSHIYARLDIIQSISGLILAAFIIIHLLLEASIIISKDAMLMVSKFFEGYYFFGEKYPGIISFLAAAIFFILIIHALIALRKFPSNYRQYHILKQHMKQFHHSDTHLWFYQAVTGFMMFFLASVHLYIMMTQPANIGPYASADRIYTDWLWPLYLLLLISVVTHAGIGLYRLALKWGIFERNVHGNQKYVAKKSKINRQIFKKIMLIGISLYLIIGFTSLVSYLKVGYEHRDKAGERYESIKKEVQL